MLVQLDVTSGRRRDVSVTDAAVIKDFYTIVLSDGTRSDAWETWLADLENEIAPAVRRAIEAPGFRLSDVDRRLLALWIALQYLRGPDNRRQMTEMASFTVRAQVGMGGLAYLRHAMSEGLQRDVSWPEAERVWSDITSTTGPRISIDGDEHLAILNATVERATTGIYRRSWGRIRFRRHHLAISDSPVHLVRGDTPDYLGVGLMNARAITVPLDRETLLWLSLPTTDQEPQDRDLEPTVALARAHNLAAVGDAERFVYFHPETEPIPSDAPLPRGPAPRMEVNGDVDFCNRDRSLADVLDQIGTHENGSGESLIANYTWPIPGYRPPNHDSQ